MKTMEKLINLINRSTARMQKFLNLAKEDYLAELALSREIRLHLRLSIKLYFRDLLKRLKINIKNLLTKPIR